ncbi:MULTISPECIES: hypothetical protein [unclassified Meiothermus]|uniref:hypothetical protein n=1 Tax=unclassified Meiothermus TaxID=370471 RepID=UPI000D7BD23F|nr:MULTISPECIES: hypothetical protein [unclassified Meiothermus]PZA08964.1 hypothetical protein DNA98_02780 [Meiothermus sp. Pnk-1]RYM28646.1 hypothetical protein EWH23_16370 [Meiothermus sp. PNK-Is4]
MARGQRPLAIGQRLIPYLLLAAVLLGPGQAQSLSLGLYGRLTPEYLTPTVELGYPVGDAAFELRAQRDTFGVSVESALDLSAVGRIRYGARASLGFAGWGLEAFADGGVAQIAGEVRLLYASTAPANLWVGERDPISPLSAGFNGRVAVRYRLSSTHTAGLSLSYSAPLLTAEATYALRDTGTLTVGLGYKAGLYGLLGWRGELGEEGALLEALLRAGYTNELEATLTTPLDEENTLKLRLGLAYPWVGKLGAEYANFRLDAAYDGSLVLWLRYRLDLPYTR